MAEATACERCQVFVCASSLDTDWVSNRVFPILKAHHISYNYYTDFKTGRSIAESINEAIEVSTKVIVVYSNEFLHSGWCYFESNLAIVKSCILNQQCVIPIVRNDVSNDMIPPYVRAIDYLCPDRDNFEVQLVNAITSHFPLTQSCRLMRLPREYDQCPNKPCPFVYFDEHPEECKRHVAQYCRYVQVQCPSTKFGCTETFYRKDVDQIERHECDCPLGCSSKIRHSDLQKHTDYCSQELVSCPGHCHREIARQDMHAHCTNECPFSYIKCSNTNCSERMMRIHLMKHLEECPFEIVECTVPECKTKLERIDLDAHQEFCQWSSYGCADKQGIFDFGAPHFKYSAAPWEMWTDYRQ